MCVLFLQDVCWKMRLQKIRKGALVRLQWVGGGEISPWKGDSKQCISVKAWLSLAVGCSFCPHNPTPAPALLCCSLNGSSLPSFKFFPWQCHLSLMIAWFLILWNLLPFYRSQLLELNTKPGWLKQQTFISHSSRGWTSKVRMGWFGF